MKVDDKTVVVKDPTFPSGMLQDVVVTTAVDDPSFCCEVDATQVAATVDPSQLVISVVLVDGAHEILGTTPLLKVTVLPLETVVAFEFSKVPETPDGKAQEVVVAVMVTSLLLTTVVPIVQVAEIVDPEQSVIEVVIGHVIVGLFTLV